MPIRNTGFITLIGAGPFMNAFEFVRKNAFVVAGVMLPIVVVLFVALAATLPRMFAPPPAYDVVFSVMGGWRQPPVANIRVTVDVVDGRLQLKARKTGQPPVDDDDHSERIKVISAAFAHEAELLGVPYVELYASLASDDSYRREISNNDGAHPKSNGYSKMASVVSSSSDWWFRAP